jgi:Na+/H+-dicarboxylate symporter
MKIWLKLLIGALLGVALGFLVPPENATVLAVLAWAEDAAIHLGRYALAPVLFFSLAIAVFELRQEKRMWGVVFRTGAAIAVLAGVMVAVGLLAVIIFPPARIPILIEGQKGAVALDVPGAALGLFPTNAFAALAVDGDFLLPLCVLAFFLGAGLSYERNYSKHVAGLVDSLSRIFYYVASFFSEIIGAAMIVLGAYWAVRFRSALQAEVFRDLLVLFGGTAAALAGVVLPLIVYIVNPKTNPWKQLYGAAGPAIAAFFSGDVNFTLTLALRHAKENHGVQRRVNAVALSLFGAFGRAGSAMVAAMSLIVIIKSYSSLGVPLADLLRVGGAAAVVSLLLARHPGDGAFAALAVLCASFGRGFEAGYLILKPVAFYLVAVGALLDILGAALGTYLVGWLSGYQDDKEARHFM